MLIRWEHRHGTPSYTENLHLGFISVRFSECSWLKCSAVWQVTICTLFLSHFKMILSVFFIAYHLTPLYYCPMNANPGCFALSLRLVFSLQQGLRYLSHELKKRLCFLLGSWNVDWEANSSAIITTHPAGITMHICFLLLQPSVCFIYIAVTIYIRNVPQSLMRLNAWCY